MNNPIHIMIDLETLSTSPRAAIIAIGAVRFDSSGLHEEFYERINPVDAETNGEVSKETMQWWNKDENAVARLEAFGGTSTLAAALYKFTDWVEQLDPTNEDFVLKDHYNSIYLWSNGADFDLPVLKFALEQVTAEYPFNFRNHRCFRTLRTMTSPLLYSDIENKFKHSAIADAKFQGTVAINIMNHLQMRTSGVPEWQ